MRHRLLAEVDADQAERHDPHPPKLDRRAPRAAWRRRPARSARASGPGRSGRWPVPARAGTGRWRPWRAGSGTVHNRPWTRRYRPAAGPPRPRSAIADDRHPVQPHSAAVIAEHVQRRLAKLFALFEDRSPFTQEGSISSMNWSSIMAIFQARAASSEQAQCASRIGRPALTSRADSCRPPRRADRRTSGYLEP